ncbi:hypothetical protein CRG98_027531 [Punica granatum]|uniref:Serine-threonine/tyrosine-protein kinase catalytic domain-containing protein n=1 Tax=Punica granatum TaxID=22663 RepID=A0A2I0J794_PUNGR|nr:hypothetical protein CRG98_027531 [Punica granatum]
MSRHVSVISVLGPEMRAWTENLSWKEIPGTRDLLAAQETLRASVEVLGEGSFGTSCKVNLEEEPTIAVKRFKMTNLTMTEFEKLTEKMCSIRHANVATMRAYYCEKDCKPLLLSDYHDRGSMSSLLHGVSREVKAGEVFDAPLRDQASILKELQEAFHIGIWCAQKLPEERPTMSDVGKRSSSGHMMRDQRLKLSGPLEWYEPVYRRCKDIAASSH